MKTHYERLKNIYFWTLENQKKNERMEMIVGEYFGDYLKEVRKKKVYINNLSFLLTHLFILLDDLQDSEEECLCEVEYNADLMNELGVGLRHYATHKRTINYQYGNIKISNKFITDKILPLLETIGLCWMDKGFSCKNDGYNAKYDVGITYFNIRRIYKEVYLHYDDVVIDRCDNPIIVKVRDNAKKKYVVIDSDNLEYDFEYSKRYIERLKNMYSGMCIELESYDTAIPYIKNKVDDLIYSKIYNKDKFGVGYDVNINKEICKWNRYLQRRFIPYRVYHLDDDLKWGRVYGNHIDCLPNMFKPLLKINGDNAIPIDIKSSVIQFYTLNHHKEIENRQDFYKYDGLDGGIDRQHIKLLSQCLNFNRSCKEAHKAYIGMMRKELDFENMLDFYDFSCVYRAMIRQRPYLKDLFLNKDLLCKDMFMKESEFMMVVSGKLMDLSIPHISNFDAIYVGYKDLHKVLDVLYESSLDLYDKKIYVAYDEELLKELS